MADEPKPYRVYRGGRVKGKVPTPKPARSAGGGGEKPPRYAGPGPKRPRRRLRWLRWVGLAFVLFLLWLVAWSLASYFSFRSGVSAANARLPKGVARVLDRQNGMLLTHGTTILVLGSDHSANVARAGDRHSDSIMLVRTDPSHHRLYYLSILRDLRVQIPGYGASKINAAYQIGGPALTIRTVRSFTGLEIQHIVVVDFGQFKELIDKLGGVTINVKKPILSNSFDCPFNAARCRSWKGWRFAKGVQHMDGKRALIYSRVRENRLDPSESDATRAERQQQVLQAIMAQLASVGTFFDLPFIGGDLLKPLTTDLSAGDFLQLGWVKWRSGDGSAVHCRLGGDISNIGGQSVIQPNEESRSVISMFSGQSAPQPPIPGGGLYGSGCVIGGRSLVSR
jgi:LCP family protein required for cell wall assembly